MKYKWSIRDSNPSWKLAKLLCQPTITNAPLDEIYYIEVLTSFNEAAMRIELISSGYKAEIMNHYTKPPFLKFHCNNRRKYKKCSEFYEVTLFFNK